MVFSYSPSDTEHSLLPLLCSFFIMVVDARLYSCTSTYVCILLRFGCAFLRILDFLFVEEERKKKEKKNFFCVCVCV